MRPPSHDRTPEMMACCVFCTDLVCIYWPSSQGVWYHRSLLRLFSVFMGLHLLSSLISSVFGLPSPFLVSCTPYHYRLFFYHVKSNLKKCLTSPRLFLPPLEDCTTTSE